MKWGEILQHVTTEYLDDRSDMIEGAADNLWSDEVIMRYLKDAQVELARKIWPIFDCGTALYGAGPTQPADTDDEATADYQGGVANATDPAGNPLTVIPIVDKQSIYKLHPSILWVERVKLSDTDLYLVRQGEKDVRPAGPQATELPVVPSLVNPYLENPGRPIWWETQAGPRLMRIRPKPDINQLNGSIIPIAQGPTPAVMQLDVYRLPILPVDVDHLNAQPEVAEEYHLKLGLYAAGMALTNKANIDAASKKIGQDLMAEWKEFTGSGRRDEIRRKSQVMKFRFGGWANDGTGAAW